MRKNHTPHPKLIGLHTLTDRMNLILDHVCALPDLSLMTIYFQFQGGFYRQKHGCPICSPVSSIEANLSIEEVESRALTSCTGTAPRHWYRYVDNTWVKSRTQEVEAFVEHINTVDKNIKSGGRRRSLAFLYCALQEMGAWTSIFAENPPTQTNIYFSNPTTHWSTS